MLKASIVLSDLSLDPQIRDGVIVMGTSHIVPYAHPMLETLLVRTKGQWFVMVRERLASASPGGSTQTSDVDAEAFGRLYHECVLWPLDYVLIEVAQAGCRMRVRAGVHGSAPVYARATEDRVTLSWDVADIVTGPQAIDVEVASHRLAMNTVYAARQLFVGVVLLTERASFYVEPGNATYRYPAHMDDTSPSPLPEGQDALTMFGEHLHRAVSLRPVTADRLSIELSGGMDSATVASAIAAFNGPMASKGILLDGDVRAPQVQRRQWITNALGLRDETVEIGSHLPDIDLRRQPGRARGLYWEYYLEACAALWDSAQSQGHEALYSGIGGDELFPSYLHEMRKPIHGSPDAIDETRRHAERLLTPSALGAARSLRSFDAPAGPVPETTLLAHACRAPELLRRGLWPVNPLSDPGLVAFCHRLPSDSRDGREVMRRYLNARLGGDVFPTGYIKETFAQVLPELLSRHAPTIASQLRDCALADLQLIDRSAALRLLDTVAATRAQAPTAALVSFLWMERCVRHVQ
jgi:asparagine synthase (glutamine-hydrolysing)